MNVACRATRVALSVADDSGSMPARLESHLGSCLACQAEAARYRKLRRALAGLANEIVDAPAALPAMVEARLDLDGVDEIAARPSPRVGRVAAAAGAAVAAAGTVVVVRWLRTRAAA